MSSAAASNEPQYPNQDFNYMKQDNNLLKKKYNKKQLKEYFSKNRSIIGLSKNLSTISHKSNKDYNRQQYKLEVRKYE